MKKYQKSTIGILLVAIFLIPLPYLFGSADSWIQVIFKKISKELFIKVLLLTPAVYLAKIMLGKMTTAYKCNRLEKKITEKLRMLLDGMRDYDHQRTIAFSKKVINCIRELKQLESTITKFDPFLDGERFFHSLCAHNFDSKAQTPEYRDNISTISKILTK